MLHQPSGAIGGQATDIEITVREIKKLKQELNDIYSHHSGQSTDKIHDDIQRDYWMTASEAKDYGLVDEVLLINSRKQILAKTFAHTPSISTPIFEQK